MADWRKPGPKLTSALWAIGAGAILIALLLLVAKRGEIKADYALYRAENLIRFSQRSNRTTIGRLTRAPFAQLRSDITIPEDLGMAQIMLLNLPSSPKGTYLQALIDI